MSVIIRDVNMPTTCQDCPCFAVSYLADTANHAFDIAAQQCRAHKQIIRMAYSITNTDASWNRTERPEWCPMESAPDEAITSTVTLQDGNLTFAVYRAGEPDPVKTEEVHT